MRTGRPSRVNVDRYPGGKIKPEHAEPRKETEAEILGAALFQRAKLGATLEDVKDSTWTEDPLYMMRRWAWLAKMDSEGLSADQFAALKLYCAARGRAYRAQGLPAGFPACVMRDMASEGPAAWNDNHIMDDERVYELRREFNAARAALLEHADRGVNWVRLLDSLAKSEKAGFENEYHWRKMLPEIRSAANVLVRYYGLVGKGG